MTTRVERVEDRLADFTRDKRILILSLMAIVIGVLSAVVAKLLVWLIALITNLVFFQKNYQPISFPRLIIILGHG